MICDAIETLVATFFYSADLDRVGLRTVKVVALVGSIVVKPVTLQAVRHMVPVDVFGVHSVPACWELDVDFQLCVGTGVTNRNSNITSTSLNREEAMIFLVRKKMSGMS